MSRATTKRRTAKPKAKVANALAALKVADAKLSMFRDLESDIRDAERLATAIREIYRLCGMSKKITRKFYAVLEHKVPS